MWEIVYIFLKVLFWTIDRDLLFDPPTTDLQAIFREFFVIQNETKCYIIPHPKPTERFATYCSGDLGRVFWFALAKAFRKCIPEARKETYVSSILNCVLETNQETYHFNPGIAFRREMCVVRELLPKKVLDVFECNNGIKSASGFYPLKSIDGNDCIGPCELTFPRSGFYTRCTCKTTDGWDQCDDDLCPAPNRYELLGKFGL